MSKGTYHFKYVPKQKKQTKTNEKNEIKEENYLK